MAIDWQSPVEMARDLLAAKYLCLLCLGAIVIDFAHSLSFDYHLVFESHRRKGGNNHGKIRWPQICYFVCKILYFPYWTVTFITGDPSFQVNCQTVMLISETFLGIITCLCSALLAFRTICIWDQHWGKPVSGSSNFL